MKRYHTETERIANETFDKVMHETMLPHAKFYVNGVEWREGDALPEPSLPERPYGERWRIASEGEQEDFWSHLPHEEMGLTEPKSVMEGLMVYLALLAVLMGTLGLLAMGLVELWKVVRG